MTRCQEFTKHHKATKFSAFMAGLVLGILGAIYEFLSFCFAWTADQRHFYFWPLAIFAFLIPTFVFVAGPPYFSERDKSEGIQVPLRMFLWFGGFCLGALTGMAAIKGSLWLFSFFD